MQASHSTEADGECISLSKLKDITRRLLLLSSTTRSVILAEKDVLPVSGALVKFEIFDRLSRSEPGV